MQQKVCNPYWVEVEMNKLSIQITTKTKANPSTETENPLHQTFTQFQPYAIKTP